MKRDGYCESLWQSSQPAYGSQNVKLPKELQDVVIVGGGITGVTTALLLQLSGKKCVLAEARNLGFGTTGGTTAHINTFPDTPFPKIVKNFSEEDAQLVVKGLSQAVALIKNHIREYKIDCGFRELTGYMFATDEKQVKELDEIVEVSSRLGIPIEFTDKSPIPVPFLKIASIQKQAQFHPIQYLYALAELFEKSGGVILQDCRVLNADENDSIVVETSKGDIQCRSMIYATHIPPGVNLLHFRCAPYRSYAIAVTLKDGEYPDAVAYDLQEPYHYYRSHHAGNRRFLISGGEDHKTGHEDNAEACFRRLESHTRSHFNVEDIAFRWSSQYFEPTDGLPYIGHLPGHPGNIYVATGFSGTGINFGTFSAILLRDLITKGESEYAELFDPNRIKPVAGFSNFVKEAADVVAKLVGGIFPSEKLDTISDLAKDEARIVEFEGKRMGIYKDDAGELFAVNTACTHINCRVQWNTAEKTWDCPCHGSRFSYSGEVLNAPSRKDLEVYELDKRIAESAEKHISS
jgi:glycine/D-amino acid oxidase-like deaminating enzyme/nitrite reductase/ring-hydroxylating ferredoxin subunit